ncbi:SemiSWEET transporter [Flavobacterium piscis]|uniref:MtN3 and saliva related transmembrane protein n=1 Tax=Flavobacterium piscis TaxID=1114874 RepID=A0ABU1Y9Q3_9FLAO|nr:SemiSWEET transporter [Flavobacterium piscis]MDR7210828.1 MtN3 and saliva related transmembrane protein [Flavobacterium piscis]
MNITDILGVSAGICVTISVVPQIVKVWKTKKVKQISLLTFSVLTFGIALWIVYGILKKDFPIILSNSISLFLNLIMVYFIIYYEKE